ncbi:NYN domain-containing protein [Heliobacterium chlorum]|uniref:NYN domain-containing protein n=1 Tax=Heliobacterium chlorum TaxID=2698 RepID=A0ABR7T3K5_HELCL|nr:NYN domain-containing protein [Heliobacterium chlorum]MBC9785236.1 NYN domain-containing protein [Heliobacterium chlorum]
MKDILIVDGYNALNAWPNLAGLRTHNFEHARDRLIDALAEYGAVKGMEVIIVFDAHLVKGGVERVEQRPGIQVVYTREDETADRYIERVLGRLKRANIWVATGDAVEQFMALGRGACRLPVRELYHQVETATRDRRRMTDSAVERSKGDNSLDSRISEDVRQKLERMRRGLLS